MEYTYGEPIQEVIAKRHSVRNYEKRAIPQKILLQINDYITQINIEHIGKVRIQLIQMEDASKEYKLGTYGVISGAQYFLCAVSTKKEYSLETLGYAFEKVILYYPRTGE